MPKVIVDTTPITSLLKIGKLEILRNLYGTIIIPNAVFIEVEAGRDKLYFTDLKNCDWISWMSEKLIDRIKSIADEK